MWSARSLLASSMNGLFSSSESNFHSAPRRLLISELCIFGFSCAIFLRCPRDQTMKAFIGRLTWSQLELEEDRELLLEHPATLHPLDGGVILEGGLVGPDILLSLSSSTTEYPPREFICVYKVTTGTHRLYVTIKSNRSLVSKSNCFQCQSMSNQAGVQLSLSVARAYCSPVVLPKPDKLLYVSHYVCQSVLLPTTALRCDVYLPRPIIQAKWPISQLTPPTLTPTSSMIGRPFMNALLFDWFLLLPPELDSFDSLTHNDVSISPKYTIFFIFSPK